MYLNTIKYAAGAKTAPKRLGRGIGSGLGKTCGRGHKGQHARAGGFHKLGFEGGQMPIQRRLPKFGFNSLKSTFTEEVRIDVLNKIDAELIDLAILKQKNIISASTKCAKVIASGKLNKAVRLVGISVTAGARAAIEAAGGSVE